MEENQIYDRITYICSLLYFLYYLMENTLILNYYSFLILKNSGYNPFEYSSNAIKSKIEYPKSDEDNSEKDIRFPICLRLAWNPLQPNSCSHVFCKDCLEIWAQTKLSCPICRALFDEIRKIDYEKFNYSFQGDLFV